MTARFEKVRKGPNAIKIWYSLDGRMGRDFVEFSREDAMRLSEAIGDACKGVEQ